MVKKSSSTGFEGETIAARIPIAEMIVDEYQGHVNENLVKKIAEAWDDSAAGAIVLNMRDTNTYAVLDGQHRVRAAKQANQTELNALVFVGKTREEEARLFVQLNTKHAVSPYDKFKANLVAGQYREKTIVAAVKELGLEISNVPYKANSIRSVQALGKLYDDYGLPHLKLVLGTLQSAFGSYNDHNAFNEASILGMSGLFARYPEVNVPKLIERLKKYSPTTIRGMGGQRIELGESSWVGWGRAVTGIYNHGLRSSAKDYLPIERWNKIKYSPRTKKGHIARGKSDANINHLRPFQFKKGLPSKAQPSFLRAAAKKSKA